MLGRHKTSTGQEYLEFIKEEKLIQEKNLKNVCCAKQQKMSSRGLQRQQKKRSAEMKNNDALFYLAVDNVRSSSGKPLFKKAPVGVKNANENNGTESRT